MAVARRQPALVRAVNAMMRALGGAMVKVRIPAASTSGTQRELGIAAAAFQEAELAPVVVRELGGQTANAADRSVPGTQPRQIELLISSSALDALMPAFGANDGLTFLRLVQQVVHEDVVFTVTQVSADRFAEVAYMYRVAAVSSNQ